MRLTLRTMLAYLDEVLEPADAELLGKKIQDSEFASSLVHRIRNSTRRLRLDAPKLEGKGMGLDPNTVAEYLDSALSSDRVPDFEKVCLESDVHLAEVAACHQVLTLVLGEPADVRPSLRDRIYSLGVTNDNAKSDDRQTTAVGEDKTTYVDTPHATQASGDVTKTRDVKPTREKPKVPDYLRANKGQRLWPLVATAALAFLIAGLVLWVAKPFGSQQPKDNSQTVRVLDGDTTNNGDSETTEKPSTVNNSTTDSEPPMPENPVQRPTVTEDSLPKVLPNSVTPPTGPDLPEVDPRDPVVVATAKPIPNDAPTLPKPTGDSDTKKDKPSKDVVVGRFISNQQVLARLDSESGKWMRLPSNAPLVEDDQLLVFPTYRPQIALTSGIQLTLDDATLLTLKSSLEDATPILEVHYGRALLVTNGKANTHVELNLGGRRGVATFVNSDSALALEVRRYRRPGTNPETIPAQTIVQIFATGGQIEWQESGETVSINVGQMRTFIDDTPGHIESASELPSWIRSKRLENIDLRASQELESKLDGELPIALTLKERVNAEKERHVEVRSLAITCLSYLDNYEPFVEALGDDTYKSYWNSQLATARDALSRSEKSAIEMRIAFEKLRGDDAPGLYRLLWGYSPTELGNNGAAELVAHLENDSMDFRVLAFDNLLRITGMSLLYRPERSASRNRSSVQKWKTRLEEESITYTAPPSPLPTDE